MKEETRATIKKIPRNIWVVTGTNLLTDVSSEMVLNLVSLFLANVLGVRPALIGLIEGIAESTASVLKVFSGWISDKLGKRKALAVIGNKRSPMLLALLVKQSLPWKRAPTLRRLR